MQRVSELGWVRVQAFVGVEGVQVEDKDSSVEVEE